MTAGQPNTIGTFRVTITGRDSSAAGQPGTFSFNWTITPPSITTVPSLLGDGPDQAFSALAAVGLVVGSQDQTVDCNNLNAVSQQSPARGTQLAWGSAVNLVFGTPPAPPDECP